MTSADPLKSVISIGDVDDTSLAVPSVNQFRSGEQRVREQVQTVRRTKSRQFSSRSGSASLSPTSPTCDSVFGDPLKSQSGLANGSVFYGNGFSKAQNVERNANRNIVNISMGSGVKRNASASTYLHERSYVSAPSMAVDQPNSSRSEPDLAWQRSRARRSVPLQRFSSNMGNYRKDMTINEYITKTRYYPLYTGNGTSQNTSNNQFVCSRIHSFKTPSKPPVTVGASKNKVDTRSTGVTDLTMKEAVECLSSEDQTYQNCGASFIQHNAYMDDKAKEEVLKLNGIPPLVNLLHSPSSQVAVPASAALRNLSFKNDSCKEAIQRCSGITETVAVLKDTNSVEIKKQLTGLLWNLSSADNLKPDLLRSALPVLVERVIVPYAKDPDRTNDINPDSEVFFHTTGCLRNLSSAKQNNRQAMRKSQGLIDSLVSYIGDCVEVEKPDHKSVENSVCILHNLTFQLEAEAPTLFSRITALAKNVNRSNSQGEAGAISCFASPDKSAEHEYQFDFPVVEDQHPTGPGWLFHSKTLQSYLSLLGSSQQEETLEACCGAMQNLTAHEGIVSSVMSQTIVQKLNGLSVISPLLRSDKVNLQKNIVALLGNLTKNRNLHNAIARKALPELLEILRTGTKKGNESDDTLAMTCQAANCLLMKEPEMGKRLLDSSLIDSLDDLSRNKYFPKSSKAAALLLYNMWSEKDLQSFLKKQGMSKAAFMNDITMAAHKSVQVVH
ncbi:plakophilin-1-like [Anabas testudineus]|uniref:Plakophilin 1b n=1 Tax=Anabas testudineus TaxID=64144 RepID=A0A3Q1JN23_ANATE|nr:plakophilin-1-like [Anabas testudineus]